MALRGPSGVAPRVIQVLKDFLPAELDLIDAEEADGITTPDIGASNYHHWDRSLTPQVPACMVRVVESTPVEIRPNTFGQRADVLHRVDVMFKVGIDNAGSNPENIPRLLYRYVTGAMRVLCIMKEALQTTADPTRWAEIVTWAGPATYGPDPEQDDGTVVRTATLPIDVRRREART